MINKFEELSHEREPILSEGIDFYKLTMGQVALEKHPDAEVTFTLANRDLERPLSEYVDVNELQSKLKYFQEKGFTPEEIAYFAGLQAQDKSARFDEQYLDFLADIELPDVSVSIDEKTKELSISSTGNWAAVSLWETVAMNEANEMYYVNKIKADGLNIYDVYDEGDRRLTEKIKILKDRPDIKIVDFGTRRRFSASWQEYILGRLSRELPNNLIGTSNPWFAYKFGIKPIGTYAHEMPMVYAAIADKNGENPMNGQQRMLSDWYNRYGEDLSIALTDTFTSELFFAEFTPEQAELWKGVRHDSGDPFEFGEKVIKFYELLGIEPKTKTIIFSDGLDLEMILKIADHFKDRVNVVFGWGTTLMNDMGLKPNNIVMKATRVNGVDTVKLSDSKGKYTGPINQIEKYINEKNIRIAEIYEHGQEYDELRTV